MEPKEVDFVQSLTVFDDLNFFNGEIRAILEEFYTVNDIRIQQDCIKKLRKHLERNDLKEDAEKVLTYMFLFTALKNPIRKTLTKSFNNVNNLNNYMWEHLKTKMNKLDENKLLSCKNLLDDLINGLYIFVENDCIFKDITNELLTFLVRILSKLHSTIKENNGLIEISMEQLYYFLHHFVRILLIVIQKCEPPEILASQILSICFHICIDKYASFDMKANSAHVMIINAKFIPIEMVTKSDRWLEFVSFLNNKQSNLKDFLKYQEHIKKINFDVYESFKVCIILAIIKTVPLEEMKIHSVNGYSIALYFFNELLECVKHVTGKPIQILEVTRAILIACNNLDSLTTEELEVIFIDSLNFVFNHLDHYMNTIRFNTKEIFIKLIRVAQDKMKQGNSHLEEIILNEVFKSQDSGNNFFLALEVLSKEIGCSKILEKHPSIPITLLTNLTQSDLVSEICSCFKNLMTLHFHEIESKNEWKGYWVEVLLPLLQKDSGDGTTFAYDLFSEAFRLCPSILPMLLQHSEGLSDGEIIAFLRCLRYLRREGIKLPVEEIYGNKFEECSLWRSLIGYDVLQILHTYHNNDVHISALALVIESHKSTEIFTKFEFDFLVSYFEKNMSIISRNIHQQMIGLGRKLFTRYLESITVLKRNKTQITNMLTLIDNKKLVIEDNSKKEKLEKDLENINWSLAAYIQFWTNLFSKSLALGLIEGANNPRRTSCLELLLLSSSTIDMGDWLQVWNKKDIENLKRIIEYDTYESNKIMAFKLSQKLGCKKLCLNDYTHVRPFFAKSLEFISSTKPADTLSGTYMFMLSLDAPCITELLEENLRDKVNCSDKIYKALVLILERIADAIVVAKDNLLKAAMNKPLYGLFLMLRHLIKSADIRVVQMWPLYREIITKIIDFCFIILPVIFEVVCDSSPEGYFPDENETNDVTVTAQILLVYTWRTAKETSLLLGEISLNLPIQNEQTKDGLISEQQMERIGDFFINFLMKAKHRGAFEQGYIGFANYCKRLWTSSNINISSLPETWLRKIVDGLKEKDVYINACATRRSAGLPFMVQALLTTEPSTQGNKLFHYTMKTLISIANDEENEDEQKIHSMNILKALYKHNQLGELVMPYISEGVMIAVKGFSNKNWSIRNSATLLLSALITRMFGVQRLKAEISSKNKLTAHVFFMRYPKLYQFLLEMLEEGLKTVNDPSLYAVLLIFGRLYPGKRNEDSKFNLHKFLPFIEICLSNIIFQIRDLAAAASVSMIPSQQVNNYILNIFERLENTQKENYRQGLILQLHYLLKSIKYQSLKLHINVLPPVHILINVGKTVSHLSGALYIEVLAILIRKLYNTKQCPSLKLYLQKVFYILSQQENEETTEGYSISTAQKKYECARCFLKLLCGVYAADNFDLAVKFLQKQISFLLMNSNKNLEQFSLNIINYIRMFDNLHNLYLTEELEKSELETEFVNILPHEIRTKFNTNLNIYLRIPLLYIFKKLKFQSNKFIACYLLALQSDIKLLDVIFDSADKVVDGLINLCSCKDNEQIISAVISALSIYLQKLDNDDFKRFIFSFADEHISDDELNQNKLEDKEKVIKHSKLVLFLEQCASPVMSQAVRLSVCDFFLQNKSLFYNLGCILSGNNLVKVWYIITTLIEDDEPLIKNRVSQIFEKPFEGSLNRMILPKRNVKNAECCKEEILKHVIDTIPEPYLVEYYLILIFRQTKTKETDEECETLDMFSKEIVNIHSEEALLVLKAQEYLKKVLWGTSSKEKSVSKGEIILEICKKLCKAFSEVDINKEVKTEACNALERFILLFEDQNIKRNEPSCTSVLEELTIHNLKDFFQYILS